MILGSYLRERVTGDFSEALYLDRSCSRRLMDPLEGCSRDFQALGSRVSEEEELDGGWTLSEDEDGGGGEGTVFYNCECGVRSVFLSLDFQIGVRRALFLGF